MVIRRKKFCGTFFYDLNTSRLQVVRSEASANYKKLLEGRYTPKVYNRDDYRIMINSEGFLTYRGSILSNHNEETMSWIMESDGSFYAVSSAEESMNHYTLMQNVWPISAGEMKVQNGMISMLKSFEPSQAGLKSTTKYLQSQGVMMDYNTAQDDLDETMGNPPKK